jgi:hypothetical protein
MMTRREVSWLAPSLIVMLGASVAGCAAYYPAYSAYPPPPPAAWTPNMVWLPSPGVYVALGYNYPLFFHGGSYHYAYGGRWYSGPSYRGPWGNISRRRRRRCTASSRTPGARTRRVLAAITNRTPAGAISIQPDNAAATRVPVGGSPRRSWSGPQFGRTRGAAVRAPFTPNQDSPRLPARVRFKWNRPCSTSL